MKEINLDLIKKIFPKRDNSAHKGTYHKVLMIGGSKMMHGAIELAATSAYRSGVGTLTLLIPDIIYQIIALKCNFAMTKTTKDDGNAMIYEDLGDFYNNFDIITIGSGMTRSNDTLKYLKDVLKSKAKVIIDADALFMLKDNNDLLDLNKDIIITPHIKEFSYITGLDINEILSRPYEVLNDFSIKHKNVTTILKSSYSIIQKEKEVYTLNRPTSALAKGGSGDILLGIIAGILAQGVSSLDATIISSYVHNECGHIKKDPLFVLPDDIINELNRVYTSIR